MKGITELLKEIESRWDTKTGLALVLFVVVAGAIWIFGTVDLARIESWQWAVIGLLGLGITAYWRYRRFPRAPDGKVGFGVAIQYESTPEAPKIKADFADRLRALIQASDHLRHKFHFIEFGEHASRRFTETANPEQLVLRTNTHFLLFGTAKSRLLSAGPSFVVELKGIVRHGPLDAEAKRLFGNDFSGVLSSKVIVNESNSILAFEFAARQIDVVARYVIGTAAALTGDLIYADQLLLEALDRLEVIATQSPGPHIAPLRSRIRARLGELYDLLLIHCLRRYTVKRDTAGLREADELIKRQRERGLPETYRSKLAAATAAFLLDGDTRRARQEIEACRDEDDGAWQYSAAFLAAYDSDLDRAYRLYRAAFQAPLLEETVPIQCEEFIHEVLEREPQRYWLHFCLGMINQRVKNDPVSAQRDFQEFLNRTEAGRFPNQVRAAREWVRELSVTPSL